MDLELGEKEVGKDFTFFLILLISILVLVLDLVFIALGIWKMMQLNAFDILNLDFTRPFLIALIVINAVYFISLALYLAFRRVR